MNFNRIVNGFIAHFSDKDKEFNKLSFKRKKGIARRSIHKSAKQRAKSVKYFGTFTPLKRFSW